MNDYLCKAGRRTFDLKSRLPYIITFTQGNSNSSIVLCSFCWEEISRSIKTFKYDHSFKSCSNQKLYLNTLFSKFHFKSHENSSKSVMYKEAPPKSSEEKSSSSVFYNSKIFQKVKIDLKDLIIKPTCNPKHKKRPSHILSIIQEKFQDFQTSSKDFSEWILVSCAECSECLNEKFIIRNSVDLNLYYPRDYLKELISEMLEKNKALNALTDEYSMTRAKNLKAQDLLKILQEMFWVVNGTLTCKTHIKKELIYFDRKSFQFICQDCYEKRFCEMNCFKCLNERILFVSERGKGLCGNCILFIMENKKIHENCNFTSLDQKECILEDRCVERSEEGKNIFANCKKFKPFVSVDKSLGFCVKCDCSYIEKAVQNFKVFEECSHHSRNFVCFDSHDKVFVCQTCIDEKVEKLSFQEIIQKVENEFEILEKIKTKEVRKGLTKVRRNKSFSLTEKIFLISQCFDLLQNSIEQDNRKTRTDSKNFKSLYQGDKHIEPDQSDNSISNPINQYQAYSLTYPEDSFTLTPKSICSYCSKIFQFGTRIPLSLPNLPILCSSCFQSLPESKKSLTNSPSLPISALILPSYLEISKFCSNCDKIENPFSFYLKNPPFKLKCGHLVCKNCLQDCEKSQTITCKKCKNRQNIALISEDFDTLQVLKYTEIICSQHRKVCLAFSNNFLKVACSTCIKNVKSYKNYDKCYFKIIGDELMNISVEVRDEENLGDFIVEGPGIIQCRVSKEGLKEGDLLVIEMIEEFLMKSLLKTEYFSIYHPASETSHEDCKINFCQDTYKFQNDKTPTSQIIKIYEKNLLVLDLQYYKNDSHLVSFFQCLQLSIESHKESPNNTLIKKFLLKSLPFMPLSHSLKRFYQLCKNCDPVIDVFRFLNIFYKRGSKKSWIIHSEDPEEFDIRSSHILFIKGIILASPKPSKKKEDFPVTLEFFNIDSGITQVDSEKGFMKVVTEIRPGNEYIRILFDRTFVCYGKTKLFIRFSKGFYHFAVDPVEDLRIGENGFVKIHCSTQVNGNNNFAGPFLGFIVDEFYCDRFLVNIERTYYK